MAPIRHSPPTIIEEGSSFSILFLHVPATHLSSTLETQGRWLQRPFEAKATSHVAIEFHGWYQSQSRYKSCIFIQSTFLLAYSRLVLVGILVRFLIFLFLLILLNLVFKILFRPTLLKRLKLLLI